MFANRRTAKANSDAWANVKTRTRRHTRVHICAHAHTRTHTHTPSKKKEKGNKNKQAGMTKLALDNAEIQEKTLKMKQKDPFLISIQPIA